MKKIILIVTSILILLLLNINIYKKEQIILHGENVFLELEPVDPRSLIQGDYMRLRYNLHIDKNKIAENNQRGYIVIGLNENKVGLFKRFYSNEQLANDEKIIKYRSNGYELIVQPNSFMFQEGHGKIYEKAKYGVFKFDNKNNYILFNLADEKLQIINPDEK